MTKACVLNTKDIPSSRDIGNMWYSNALASGGEGFAAIIKGTQRIRMEVVNKIIEKKYKIVFLCFGKRSGTSKYLDLIMQLKKNKICVILQQVHSTLDIDRLRQASNLASCFITPIKDFAKAFNEQGIKTFYFPNAVSEKYISSFIKKDKTRTIDIFLESFRNGPGYVEYIKLINKLGDHTFFSTTRLTQNNKFNNLKLFQYVPQVEFYKYLSMARIACDLTRKKSFGRFAVECGFLGIPIVSFEGRDSQNNIAPELIVKSSDQAIELLNKLLSDYNFYTKEKREILTRTKNFYSLESWNKRYKDLIDKLL